MKLYNKAHNIYEIYAISVLRLGIVFQQPLPPSSVFRLSLGPLRLERMNRTSLVSQVGLATACFSRCRMIVGGLEGSEIAGHCQTVRQMSSVHNSQREINAVTSWKAYSP